MCRLDRFEDVALNDARLVVARDQIRNRPIPLEQEFREATKLKSCRLDIRSRLEEVWNERLPGLRGERTPDVRQAIAAPELRAIPDSQINGVWTIA